MSAAPIVAMRGIVKHFGRVVALDGVDLTVMPGEVHAVVGENGAGKSTLMHILSGMVQPDAGRIEVRGGEVTIATVE
ncbi:MAG TPA: ATP-binding cassette domain-containing protein, partial [Ardenticatenaceae bacterium]|nr:ATP-binding cassette domain-containing protein [Ardenticatenaceae bacterium]